MHYIFVMYILDEYSFIFLHCILNVLFVWLSWQIPQVTNFYEVISCNFITSSKTFITSSQIVWSVCRMSRDGRPRSSRDIVKGARQSSRGEKKFHFYQHNPFFLLFESNYYKCIRFNIKNMFVENKINNGFPNG